MVLAVPVLGDEAITECRLPNVRCSIKISPCSHPPFGHVTEGVLQKLSEGEGLTDSFEGNAQSFRVITKLEVREADAYVGLNLTQATLNAILKYPWLRGDGKKAKKWGSYESEKKEFLFARDGSSTNDEQSLEAALMDWADDIAYSIHDCEDFYRANILPLDRLIRLEDEKTDFMNGVFRRQGITKLAERRMYEKMLDNLCNLFYLYQAERFEGTRRQIAHLRMFVSILLERFEKSTRLNSAGLDIPGDIRIQVCLLKELIWHYVIENPMLASQQEGQKRLISDLFEIYHNAISKDGNLDIFPPLVRDNIRVCDCNEGKIRLIVDLIASFTESQAINMHQRLTGAKIGSAFKALVY